MGTPTLCLPVYEHVVPDNAMVHTVQLGRDSWSNFPVRKVWDLSDTETTLTFVGRDGGSTAGDRDITKWIDSAVGIIETTGRESVEIRFACARHRLPNAVFWIPANVTNVGGA